MKKRYRYIDGTKFEDGTYFRILQELTWRFYFRFIKGSKGWFTPCTKCQNSLDKMYSMNALFVKTIFDFSSKSIFIAEELLCEKCTKSIFTMVREAEEVIFGNSDYEPLVEVSRLWLDNDNEVHDVTKEEYEKERPYKYL